MFGFSRNLINRRSSAVSGRPQKQQKRAQAIEQLEERRLLATLTPPPTSYIGSGQILSFFGDPPVADISQFREQYIIIADSKIANLPDAACQWHDGVGDFVIPVADVYILLSPQGLPKPPELAIGGSVVGPITVIAGPSGLVFTTGILGTAGTNVGRGRYAIVFDECQDAFLDFVDAFWDPAFFIEPPVDAPSQKNLRPLKVQAQANVDFLLKQDSGLRDFIPLADQPFANAIPRKCHTTPAQAPYVSAP